MPFFPKRKHVVLQRGYHRAFRENPWNWEGARPKSNWQFLGFAAAGSLTAYGLAMVVDAERERSRRARWLSTTKRQLTGLDAGDSSVFGDLTPLRHKWQFLTESQKTMIVLMAMNGAVFLAWRLPRLDRFMSRYFLHSTTSNPLTMLTSIFSHKTVTHLAFNMLALWSFGGILHDCLGREQFLAFYTTAGLAASMGSHLYKAWQRDAARSLGASGALFGVAGACAHIPDVKVSLIFLPFHSFSLDSALPFVMAFDAVGLWKGWHTFDHAAHLSGAASGYLLYTLSTRHIWSRRRRILSTLHYPVK